MRQLVRFSCVIVTLLCVACSQSAPSDDTITAGVKSGLAADATVRTSQVDVITKDSVVTLSGRVQTATIGNRPFGSPSDRRCQQRRRQPAGSGGDGDGASGRGRLRRCTGSVDGRRGRWSSPDDRHVSR